MPLSDGNGDKLRRREGVFSSQLLATIPALSSTVSGSVSICKQRIVAPSTVHPAGEAPNESWLPQKPEPAVCKKEIHLPLTEEQLHPSDTYQSLHERFVPAEEDIDIQVNRALMPSVSWHQKSSTPLEMLQTETLDNKHRGKSSQDQHRNLKLRVRAPEMPPPPLLNQDVNGVPPARSLGWRQFQNTNQKKITISKHRPLEANRHPVPALVSREDLGRGSKFAARSISLLGTSTSVAQLDGSDASFTGPRKLPRTRRQVSQGLRTVSAPPPLEASQPSLELRPTWTVCCEERRASQVRKLGQKVVQRTQHERCRPEAHLFCHLPLSPVTLPWNTSDQGDELPTAQPTLSLSTTACGDDSTRTLPPRPSARRPIPCHIQAAQPLCEVKADTTTASVPAATATTAASSEHLRDSLLLGCQCLNRFTNEDSHTLWGATGHPIGSHVPDGTQSSFLSAKLAPQQVGEAAESRSLLPTRLLCRRSAHQTGIHHGKIRRDEQTSDHPAAAVQLLTKPSANQHLVSPDLMGTRLEVAEKERFQTSKVCSKTQIIGRKKQSFEGLAPICTSKSSRTIHCRDDSRSPRRPLHGSKTSTDQITMTLDMAKTTSNLPGACLNTQRRRPLKLQLGQGGALSDENEMDSDANEISPCSASGSFTGSHYASDDYDTPPTSPEPSPWKMNSHIVGHKTASSALVQFDGSSDYHGDDFELSSENGEALSSIGVTAETVADKRAEKSEDSEDSLPGSYSGLRVEESLEAVTAAQSEAHHIDMMDLKEQYASVRSSELDRDDMTPLGPASPAKGAHAFPFPAQPSVRTATASNPRLRRPSALYEHCEHNASPLQKRLMATGVQSVDRFVPSRSATPTKESLHLPKPPHTTTSSGRRAFVQTTQDDPFGPAPRRSLRMAEQYATIRQPPPVPRAVGMIGSRVRDAQAPNLRAASAGTIWSVGGTVVTEGVASVTSGRGGRITSGSNAPHYTADFLRKNSRSEEEITHGRRLALAMDITPKTRILEQSSPTTPKSGERTRVWRDGAWEVEGDVTPTKSPSKKMKDVPVIPFRVLDAPALRDDYYCSLLAYSHSVECLAVGLGPHVYLWSEQRGPKTIPDSLTVPAGSAHVTSLSFSSQEGGSAILAIGRADGRITLWSPLDRDPRFDSEQPAPVSCVCFRPNTVRRKSLRDSIATVATEELLVGDEIGSVYCYSVEWPDQDQRDLFDWHGGMTLLARITCHSQQICGIAWSLDGEYFATGGNDNQLILFETKKILLSSAGSSSNASPRVHVRTGSSASSNATVTGQNEVLSISLGQEKQIFTLNAAVKAIAFAPWQSSLLAAGGGSNDRCIHFFHTLSGAALATIDCHAQVTSLVWSSKRKEIAATFGFAQPEHPFRVAVFAWPGCGMVIGIPWFGEERALFAVGYPRGPGSSQPPHRARRREHEGAERDVRSHTEGQPWYGRRTREEGCLVVATSDASIKFHEIWAERHDAGRKRKVSGALGGSQILEGECSPGIAGLDMIR